MVDYLGGEKDEDCDGLGEDVYHCNVFLCRSDKTATARLFLRASTRPDGQNLRDQLKQRNEPHGTVRLLELG